MLKIKHAVTSIFPTVYHNLHAVNTLVIYVTLKLLPIFEKLMHIVMKFTEYL